VGLLAGGATLWGVQCVRNKNDEAEAAAGSTTRPSGYHGGGHYVGTRGVGGNSAGVTRRGFGSTGGRFSGHS
jgi:hypothetical protein